MQQQNFFREKFDVLLIASLFLIAFGSLIVFNDSTGAGTLKEITQAFLYALLALVGARMRPGQSTIGTASTDTGDVNITPAADPPKEIKEHEKV